MRPKMTAHEQDHLLYEQKPSVLAFFHPPTALLVGIARYLFCIGANKIIKTLYLMLPPFLELS
jgi:hypothetical protein